MNADAGSNYAPQRMSETNAEHRERTGQEPLAPAPSIYRDATKARTPGWPEWTLGLGGPILLVLGWIISGTAADAAAGSDGGFSLAGALWWQSLGSLLSWLGVAFIVILISIEAAVNTYFRHRDRHRDRH